PWIVTSPERPLGVCLVTAIDRAGFARCWLINVSRSWTGAAPAPRHRVLMDPRSNTTRVASRHGERVIPERAVPLLHHAPLAVVSYHEPLQVQSEPVLPCRSSLNTIRSETRRPPSFIAPEVVANVGVEHVMSNPAGGGGDER